MCLNEPFSILDLYRRPSPHHYFVNCPSSTVQDYVVLVEIWKKSSSLSDLGSSPIVARFFSSPPVLFLFEHQLLFCGIKEEKKKCEKG